MSYVLVIIASLAVSALTFFSGFGLGTLLLPVFALFFSMPVAVAATAVIHLFNNLVKVVLVGKYLSPRVVLLFGIPAACAAIGGAWLLGNLSTSSYLIAYEIFGNRFSIFPVKLVIGVLMILFAFFELSPALDRYSLSERWIPLGGLLSGFFGGLSGHQGALRTIFLTRAGLDRDAFVGTITVVAVLVDVVRVTVYGVSFWDSHFIAVEGTSLGLVITACGSALAGSIIGSRLLTKMTMRKLRYIIGTLLFFVGIGLAMGIL